MIKKNFSLLFKKEKKIFLFLVIVVFISSSLEVLGLFSVMPFIAIVSDSRIIEENILLNKFYYFTNNIFQFNNTNSFVILIGLISICGIFLSLFFRLTNVFLISKFINQKEHVTTSYLFSQYLNQPYDWFYNQNISQINKNILSEANLVITGSLLSFLNLLSHTLLTFLITSTLILIYPILSLTIILSIGLIYFLIFSFLKKKLFLLGNTRLKTNSQRFETVNKAFSNFKIIKLLNLENHFTNDFKKSSKELFKTHILSDILGVSPKFFIEFIVFSCLICFIIFYMAQGIDFTSIIPTLSLFALAAYKIIPSLQQIFFSFSRMKYCEKVLDSFLKELKLKSNIEIGNENNLKYFSFNKSIKLKNICYSYAKNENKTLKNISFSIPAGSKVGIVGVTGSGKSTLVDIIMGLLTPDSGKILVDEKILDTSTIKSWKKNIGYVPQQIYLSDDSIKKNIAFGIDDVDIDLDKVKHVSKLSNLEDFILRLPNKYDTIVGERGVRLSGGEIQRIAIARAIYREPKILILDEATSSVDDQTEKLIIDAIEDKISKNLTIIHIAHRLKSLKNCDKIYELDEGEIKQEWTYKNLYENK